MPRSRQTGNTVTPGGVKFAIIIGVTGPRQLPIRQRLPGKGEAGVITLGIRFPRYRRTNIIIPPRRVNGAVTHRIDYPDRVPGN